MKSNQLLKKLLTGAISLTFIAPLVLNAYQPVNAAHKVITVKTNRDRLLFNKPGNRKYKHHNKGLKLIYQSVYHYHHQLYYRVTIPSAHNKKAYILASQTNQPKLKAHTSRYKRRIRSHHQSRRHSASKKHQVKISQRRQIHHRVTSNVPAMSSSQWFTTTGTRKIHNLNNFNQQIKRESLIDINQDRISNGKSHHYIKHLKINKILSKLANLRAKQLATNFSHYEGNHDSLNYAYVTIDSKRLGLDPSSFSWGENISRTTSTSNPTTIADQLNDGYMNNDAASNWSHRSNILNSNWSRVGIGSYHDNQTNETYQSEIFAGK